MIGRLKMTGFTSKTVTLVISSQLAAIYTKKMYPIHVNW